MPSRKGSGKPQDLTDAFTGVLWFHATSWLIYEQTLLFIQQQTRSDAAAFICPAQGIGESIACVWAAPLFIMVSFDIHISLQVTIELNSFYKNNIFQLIVDPDLVNYSVLLNKIDN